MTEVAPVSPGVLKEKGPWKKMFLSQPRSLGRDSRSDKAPRTVTISLLDDSDLPFSPQPTISFQEEIMIEKTP